MTLTKHLAIFTIITTMMTMHAADLSAQARTTYMRIAKITVDSTQLDAYKAALREQMEAALKLEPGVLAYAAVQDKKIPSRITILETYASTEAYQAHIQTDHFKKYKAAVANMVKQLELTDVVPIAVRGK
ncbi:MAG: putative quinol monooxygenase [Cyclobacteriaceae bacterium]